MSRISPGALPRTENTTHTWTARRSRTYPQTIEGLAISDQITADLELAELLAAHTRNVPDGVILAYADHGFQTRVINLQADLTAAGQQAPMGCVASGHEAPPLT